MKRRTALSVIVPAILMPIGIWLLAYQSIYITRSDLDFFKIKNVGEKHASDKISWNTFENYTREIDFENSTAIFNSIYAALRQSGSDLHPVGVTYFPAVIPSGTLMFHAGSGQIPDGLEWLAMDQEFSFNFGSRRQSYGRKSLNHGGHSFPGKPREKAPNPPGRNNSRMSRSMTMMTFRATRDLNRFIYLDGASAAKSVTGEMDTQQMLSDLIGSDVNTEKGEGAGNHRMSEQVYAERICKWGKKFGLDGFVRVEVGFEVVLCDFLNGSTELVSNVTFPMVADMMGLPPPTEISLENGWPLDDKGTLIEDELTNEQLDILDKEDRWEEEIRKFDSMVSFDQIRAGQVHDKGDKRIQLDYRYMITGINRTYMNSDPNNRRLLNNGLTLEKQLRMCNDLESALKKGFDSSESTDWQQVFDEIVDKFSPMLKVMQNILGAAGGSEDVIAQNVTKYTSGFVRRFEEKGHVDISVKLGSGRKFAVYQYTRPLKDLTTDADFLIWSAAVRVVTEIVDVVYDIHEMLWPIVTSKLHQNTTPDANIRVADSKERIDDLIRALHWISLNYRCEKLCEWDEVCYTPSWGPSPMDWATPDSTEDHFGMHFDTARNRQVIDSELKCISADFLLQKRR